MDDQSFILIWTGTKEGSMIQMYGKVGNIRVYEGESFWFLTSKQLVYEKSETFWFASYITGSIILLNQGILRVAEKYMYYQHCFKVLSKFIIFWYVCV